MSFKKLSLKFVYRSNNENLQDDFFIPVISESVHYDRAVGYFTSGSMRLIAKGLERFLGNNGRIRFVVNPFLNDADIKAIQRGERAKNDVVERALLREIELLENDIENNTLDVLSKMVSENIVVFKVAYDATGIYHEKFGIFYDNEGNKIAFSGSANATVGGMINNFEKIDVYFEKSEEKRIRASEEDFEMLWNNKTRGLEVINLPQKVREKFEQHNRQRRSKIVPRDYQLKAIKSLEEHNWHGIFNMATGTGKTFTSLMAVNHYYQLNGHMFLVILVPYIVLIEQWIKNINQFFMCDIIKCYGSRNSWMFNLHENVRDFNAGIKNLCIVISTYKSAQHKVFTNEIVKVKKRNFLIADECHNFGTKSFSTLNFPNFEGALGLSATPQRWWDEKGTKYIFDYFGDIIYEYSMAEAIKKENLCHYEYYPKICTLNDEEASRYLNLSRKITIINSESEEEIDQEELRKLLIRRSRIIDTAVDKFEMFYQNIDVTNKDEVHHTLVYCPKGYINPVTVRLRAMGYEAKKFDSTLDKDQRLELLKQFIDGKVQIITAMKCLDEGVDIPAIKEAYFLSSSSNPKEFIQRRGRILRLYKGKKEAKIFDYVVLPFSQPDLFDIVAKKEMPRFAEFAEYADNKYQARAIVRPLLAKFSLEYLLDKFPWEVYKENKERFGDFDEFE